MRAAAATAVAAVTHNQINFYFYINSFLSLLLIVVCLSDQIYRRPLHTRVLQTLLFRFIRPIGIWSKQTQQDTGETTPATKTCLSVDNSTLFKWFPFSRFPHKKTEERVLAITRTTSQQGTSSSIRKTLCGKPKTATLGPTYPSLVCCFGTSTLEKAIVLVIYRALRVSRSS